MYILAFIYIHVFLIAFNGYGLACKIIRLNGGWCQNACVNVKQVALLSLRASVQSESMPSLIVKQLVLL